MSVLNGHLCLLSEKSKTQAVELLEQPIPLPPWQMLNDFEGGSNFKNLTLFGLTSS